MKKTLEKSGRTEEDAVKDALDELGLDRDDVSVEILERAKSGFLGIGAVRAVVRVTYDAPDEPEEKTKDAPKPEKTAEAKKPTPAARTENAYAAPAKPAAEPKKPTGERTVPEDERPATGEDAENIRTFLTGLLDRMGVKAELTIVTKDDGSISVDVGGAGMGAIIGRRGETLDAIQHLTNYVVNRGSEKHVHISVDAENYRAKREESLVHLAEKMAAKVLKYKRSMALEPMNSYERHVIHTALQDYEGVSTGSTGTEPNRRVVISYERQAGAAPAPRRAPSPRPAQSARPAPAVQVNPVPVQRAEPVPAAQTEPAPSAQTEPVPSAQAEPAPVQNAEPAPAPAQTGNDSGSSKKPQSREWV